MRQFLNDPKRNEIDARGRSLRLSRIFEWYADDFGGKDALAGYADRYVTADVGRSKVEFLDYSWQLNITPPREGRWVVVTRAGQPLHADRESETKAGTAAAGAVYRVLAERNGWLRVAWPFGRTRAWIPARAVKPLQIKD